jgi:hypothetical protein
MARLVFDCDGVDVITHELIGDVITIGHASSNDVVIDDPTVSTQHASLTKLPSGYRLKDLGSTNGTQINGVSITDAELKDGTEIRFGYVTGLFQDPTASIDQGEKLQVPGEHDRPAQIKFPERSQFFAHAHNEAVIVWEMNAADFNELSEAEKRHFYQCQRCGEMVDMRQLDDVLFHEDHVQRADIQYGGSQRLEESSNK